MSTAAILSSYLRYTDRQLVRIVEIERQRLSQARCEGRTPDRRYLFLACQMLTDRGVTV